jgi:hypothetical protein
METTAGIDLASEEHRLVVVDGDGQRLEQRRYAHGEQDICALARRLLKIDVARGRYRAAQRAGRRKAARRRHRRGRHASQLARRGP